MVSDTYSCKYKYATVEYSANARAVWDFTWTAVRCNELWHCTNSARAPFLPESGCHARVCVCPLVPSFPSFSFSSSSSSLSAGRRTSADRKSIAARRWSERAEIARWAGLNGGSARVLNTSYLADRWVLRLPLAQLVACWLVGSDLHWWTLSFCRTGGAWASISRYARPAVVRKPRLFSLSFAILYDLHHHRSERSRLVDPEWTRSIAITLTISSSDGTCIEIISKHLRSKWM